MRDLAHAALLSGSVHAHARWTIARQASQLLAIIE